MPSPRPLVTPPRGRRLVGLTGLVLAGGLVAWLGSAGLVGTAWAQDEPKAKPADEKAPPAEKPAAPADKPDAPGDKTPKPPEKPNEAAKPGDKADKPADAAEKKPEEKAAPAEKPAATSDAKPHAPAVAPAAPAASAVTAKEAVHGEQGALHAQAHVEPRWHKGLAIGFALSLPMYEKVAGNAGAGFGVGNQTSLDFEIEPAWFINHSVAVGLIIAPGVVAKQAEPEEKRVRMALAPNVRYYPIHNLYLRGGFFVPILPDANFGMLYGIGAVVGHRFKGLIEASIPVTFVGEKKSYAFVLGVGFDYHIGPL